MSDLDPQIVKVLVRTQRLEVNEMRGVTIVNAGPVGPPGVNGVPGLPGTNAGQRWYGEGPPGTIVGSAPGDEYVDTVSGNLYVLQ